jgi:hypothetical protein
MLVLNPISFRGMNYEERNLLIDKSEPVIHFFRVSG